MAPGRDRAENQHAGSGANSHTGSSHGLNRQRGRTDPRHTTAWPMHASTAPIRGPGPTPGTPLPGPCMQAQPQSEGRDRPPAHRCLAHACPIRGPRGREGRVLRQLAGVASHGQCIAAVLLLSDWCPSHRRSPRFLNSTSPHRDVILCTKPYPGFPRGLSLSAVVTKRKAQVA